MKADQMVIGERGTIVDGHGTKQSCLMGNYLTSPNQQITFKESPNSVKSEKKINRSLGDLKTLQLPQKDQTQVYIYFN